MGVSIYFDVIEVLLVAAVFCYSCMQGLVSPWSPHFVYVCKMPLRGACKVPNYDLPCAIPKTPTRTACKVCQETLHSTLKPLQFGHKCKLPMAFIGVFMVQDSCYVQWQQTCSAVKQFLSSSSGNNQEILQTSWKKFCKQVKSSTSWHSILGRATSMHEIVIAIWLVYYISVYLTGDLTSEL